jgi:hypothetical protein
VAPIPGYFQTTNEGAPGPSSAAAEGPGIPQTSTRNPFAMLPVNPLEVGKASAIRLNRILAFAKRQNTH